MPHFRLLIIQDLQLLLFLAIIICEGLCLKEENELKFKPFNNVEFDYQNENKANNQYGTTIVDRIIQNNILSHYISELTGFQAKSRSFHVNNANSHGIPHTVHNSNLQDNFETRVIQNDVPIVNRLENSDISHRDLFMDHIDSNSYDKQSYDTMDTRRDPSQNVFRNSQDKFRDEFQNIFNEPLPTYCCKPVYNATELTENPILQPLCPRLCSLSDECCHNTTVTSTCAEIAQRLFSIVGGMGNDSHPCSTYCGNSICDANETCETCKEDCGPCNRESYCNNSTFFIIPNDPFFPLQWHLRNTGQSQNGRVASFGIDIHVLPVWEQEIFGNGINIAIVDDGVDWRNEDLFCSYDSTSSGDLVGRSPLLHENYDNTHTKDDMQSLQPITDHNSDIYIDPAFGKGQNPILWDNHGTAVAGLIAASYNNGKCGVGIAPKSKISAVRLLGDNFSDWQAARALHWPNIDIFSNSWGPSDNGKTLNSYILSQSAIKDGILRGRKGLGSIYIWAGGNGRLNHDNSNYDELANSIYTIAVAATDWDGVASSFSEPGTNILVNAPSSTKGTFEYKNITYSSIITTDRNGAAGYNYEGRGSELSDSSCTGLFGGTSASCPIVSGVVALMLEANPMLTWRDVQWILVRTSIKNDRFHPEWELNGGNFWFNPNYGFGTVSAEKAVELSLKKEFVCDIYTSQRETWSKREDRIPTSVSTPLVYSYNSTISMTVEHLIVTISSKHQSRGNIVIVVESPHGTTSALAPGRPKDNLPDFEDVSFMSVQFWGENSKGEWKIAIVSNNQLGIVTNIQLEIHGSPENCMLEEPDSPVPDPPPVPSIRWDRVKKITIISTVLFITIVITITILVELTKMQIMASRVVDEEILKEMLAQDDTSESEFYATSSTSSLSTISEDGFQ